MDRDEKNYSPSEVSTGLQLADAEIITLVRSGDYDRFLAIQLAPKTKRAGLYAITAFHVEIARIAESVSEPLIGHMRLAWWREGVEELAAGKLPRNHPVMLSLAPVLVAQPMLVDLLYTMIAARAVDFDDTLVAEEAAWLAYCDNTAGALHRAWAWVLDADAAREHDTAIGQQARAYAMIGLLRAIPLMDKHGWVRFPEALLMAHGVLSLAPSPALAAMAEAVVAGALALHNGPRLEKYLQPLAGLAQLNRYYIRKLQKCAYNPYRLRVEKLGKVWQMVKLNYL